MKVTIDITYLGKKAQLVVDFDDEKLVDESYSLGHQINLERITNDFFDNVQLEFKID